MGKLIRNGIEYGGGNGTDIFEVTQAQYDALVQAGTLVHNALYVITDAPNLNPTASDIEYSGAVTVKQAIDDVNTVTSPSGVTRNTTTTTSGSFEVSKCGKLVLVNITEIVSSTAYSQNELILSGLPIPSANQSFILSTNDQKAYRFRINTSGELRAWYNSPSVPSGASIYGVTSYFTT